MKNLFYVTTFFYGEYLCMLFIHLFVMTIYFPAFGHFLHKKVSYKKILQI